MEQKNKSRAERHKVLLPNEMLQAIRNEDSAWYENADEIERGLQWGKEKKRLLAWVRKEMQRRLTKKERRYLELYFFEGLSYRKAAERTKTEPSSVLRGIRRAIKKLRVSAKENNMVIRRPFHKPKP
ncbi:MAG TPA: sigma factor-like helix-turn-helix DNA-binding protein [Candidatus Hydrogenedentes bacterium]|nr:sigma factor-like helix-turn-helix DNA-binding protein [Candidatus Hydrogenedentota bacterium]HOL76919.1 sigma factor-like helix-turn-helix DNA-binding protein [Candidatus Hydrogenedentota bacterium]HPO87289.1 sigma factor-like helix-turn-helix DNA-binding protein [Candidatus Hydrogenedentota bacterium]